MIECKYGHVMVAGTGEKLIKEWICITAALHQQASEIVGVEKANELLTKSFFAAVAMAKDKEGEE